MLQPDQVSAVIITKGDVDLADVIASLVFDDVVIWDKSCEPVDYGLFSRTLAAARAKNLVIYSQDDDIIHTAENQRRIIYEYQPGVLTGCMWPEWSAGARAQGIEGGYDDLVFAGSGSVWDQPTVLRAAGIYLDHFPEDDFFWLWADTIIGVIAPTKQLDIRFEALPCAENPNRICNMEDTVALKTEAVRRARLVRDKLRVAA